MGSLDYHRTVIAYHGCDREVVRAVLDGQPLQDSERAYDWLGRGVYFWEHGPERALEWAHRRAARGDGVMKNPAVLGAYLHLGQCFDLLDTRNTALLTEAYPEFVKDRTQMGLSLPENRSPRGIQDDELALRFLDSTFLNWFFEESQKRGLQYHTARAAFTEGGPCFPGSKLMAKTHIQLAVRDRACILGYFLPRP